MVYHKDEFINLINQAEKVAAENRRRKVRFTFGDRLKPETKKQLLALRKQLADN